MARLWYAVHRELYSGEPAFGALSFPGVLPCRLVGRVWNSRLMLRASRSCRVGRSAAQPQVAPPATAFQRRLTRIPSRPRLAVQENPSEPRAGLCTRVFLRCLDRLPGQSGAPGSEKIQPGAIPLIARTTCFLEPGWPFAETTLFRSGLAPGDCERRRRK
jgi:hypothetical protein